MKTEPGRSIPLTIDQLLGMRDEVSSGEVAAAAGVTRQAAHYHLRRLVDEGELRPVGAGRTRRYVRNFDWAVRYERAGLEEDLVWDRFTQEVSATSHLNTSAVKIARFAFTEMLNNAIDHSGSEYVRVGMRAASPRFVFVVSDEGVGAFEHVRHNKGLEDHIAAIQEISKGKLTTDPSRHSGQGIFFTSKVVDGFSLASNGWRWTVDNLRTDEAIGEMGPGRGTRVEFEIDPGSTRSLKETMDRYTDDETLDFRTSRTVVDLFRSGSVFVSRAEAKRLTRNLDLFEEVVVDFGGVEEIGQGFADEIFRVWQADHPEIRLLPTNMNEAVRFMVERARGAQS